jgi:hypothetical protein
LVLAVTLAALLAACGSSTGSGSDSGNAQQLLEQTFSGPHTIKSGVLDFSLTVTPSGSSTLTSPISLSLSGPFQSRGSGQVPESDFTIAIGGMGNSSRLGLISTGTSGYITMDGSAYQLPASDFTKVASSFSSAGASGGGGLAKLGIDPLHWVTNPTVVGTSTIDGTSTTHIRAKVNVAALLADVNTLLHKASATAGSSKPPTPISAASRAKIAREVRSPTVDVWTGTSDHTLRRLSLDLGLPVSGQVSTFFGGLSLASFGVTLKYADLNQPQTISAPTNVKPFSEFERKFGSLVGQVQGATGSGSLGSSSSGSSSNSSAAARGVSKYTKCIEHAGNDVTKMQKCAGLLNGSGG